MNAQQINEALAGVPAEALDKDLVYSGVSWYDGWEDGMVKDSHAMLIQEASMVRWLHTKGFMATTYQDAKMGLVIIQPAPNTPMGSVRPFQARTFIEALAAACRAMGGA